MVEFLDVAVDHQPRPSSRCHSIIILSSAQNCAPTLGASYVDWIDLDQVARDKLWCWIRNLEAWNEKALFGALLEFSIDSDACTYGWGADSEGMSTGGLWTPEEQSWHIALQLLACSFAAVRCCTRDRIYICIRLCMENITKVR